MLILKHENCYRAVTPVTRAVPAKNPDLVVVTVNVALCPAERPVTVILPVLLIVGTPAVEPTDHWYEAS
jgi:hypothetical protein